MSVRAMHARAKAMIKAGTHPAVLGRTTHDFLRAIDKQLGEQPTEEQYRAAVETALKSKKVRGLENGLRALAEAAWFDRGPNEIKCYLQVEAEIAHDTDAR